jgi:hypothetical protein
MSSNAPKRRWYWSMPVGTMFQLFSLFLSFRSLFPYHAHEYMRCPVINQMDTSQAHLSSKGGSSVKDNGKTSDLSKDELQAVLKYGAQKMYVYLSISESHNA